MVSYLTFHQEKTWVIMKNLWGERPKDGNWSLIMILTGLLIGYHKQGRADMFGAKCAIETKATSFPGSSEVRFPNTFPDSIDLSKLPVSEKELPAFPAFGLPTGVVPLNKPVTRNFDRLFFPTHQGMIPLEGKVYKTFLTSDTGKSGRYRILKKPIRTGSSQPGACCSLRESGADRIRPHQGRSDILWRGRPDRLS
jgi:hypothetical protein